MVVASEGGRSAACVPELEIGGGDVHADDLETLSLELGAKRHTEPRRHPVNSTTRPL